MLHKHLLDFTRKYNKEFAIKGYSKLKKGELQTKIESVLNKQRTEIKEEYKKLKETVAPTPTPVKKETMDQKIKRIKSGGAGGFSKGGLASMPKTKKKKTKTSNKRGLAARK